MSSREISNTDDVIDLRDVISRVEEIRSMREDCEGVNAEEQAAIFATESPDEAEELASLEALLEECKGNGGDEQWKGSWYPVTCVRDSYFETYAQELAEDIGAVKKDAAWPNNFIDWEAAADALKIDYTSVEFDGETYWVR